MQIPTCGGRYDVGRGVEALRRLRCRGTGKLIIPQCAGMHDGATRADGALTTLASALWSRTLTAHFMAPCSAALDMKYSRAVVAAGCWAAGAVTGFHPTSL